MKQIDIEFTQRLSKDMEGIYEITKLNVVDESLKYYYIKNNSGIKSKLVIYGEIVFEIEYIPDESTGFKYLEVTTVISDLIILNKDMCEEKNPIKETNIESTSFRLIDKYNIYLSAVINLQLDEDL